MKKSNEQVREELVKYLEDTSKHLFKNKENTLFKIIKKDSEYYYKLTWIDSVNNSERSNEYKINVDDYIRWYDVNAKRALKDTLFKFKGYNAIKQYKMKKEVV